MEFESLYRQHVQAVFRFAMSITRRREVAEDLTSEAFLALYREMDTIDHAQLPAWLLTVVRNRARDQWRHQMIEERYVVEKKPVTPPAAPPASSLEEWILASAGL
jgi:RNA polymerase sigma-70 factor (ECF subfamily)